MADLLTRDQFRQQVLERDDHTCVVPWCSQDAVDAHHIIERKQWKDEGYYIENGASVCEKHHKHAEINAIPPQAFWHWLNVNPVVVPDHFEDPHYNKWGTEDERGEHFETRSELREEQAKPLKYPSTPHLPFSPEHDEHGRIDWSYEDLERLAGLPVVQMIKMDGSNASLTQDTVCSRRGAEATHKSFDELKAIHAEIQHKIPSHIQVFGEWLYAKHSIHYGCEGCCEPRDQGPPLERGKFQVFGVYHHTYDIWLSWNETVRWASRLGFDTVPVLHAEEMAEWQLQESLPAQFQQVVDEGHEGIVVRSQYPFHYGQTQRYLAKAVREGHVSSEDHWKHQQLVRNKTTEEIE